jgi:hypothetical protein
VIPSVCANAATVKKAKSANDSIFFIIIIILVFNKL